MNASLPVLPLATDSTGGLSGLGGKINETQVDSESLAGFAPLLEQAHATVSGEFAVVPPVSLDAESLLQQVETLPQAGKLLPLLGQVLDEASANGFEPRQVLRRIAEKLEQLGSNSELNPVATLVTVLHQLLDELPALKTTAIEGALTLMTADGKTSNDALPRDRTTGRALAQIMERRTGVAEAGENLPVKAAQSDVNSTGLDKALDQIQQRQPEMASVMATLNRMTLQGKSASADTPLRADSVAASVPAPTAQTSAPAASALPTLGVSTPLAQGGWDQAVGERIQWMVNQKMQGARFRLNPAQLGPMEVRIQVQNDQASIQFSSAHSMVREALEAALPRLRDMFDASGIELVDVDVSGQSFAGGQRARSEDGTVLRGMRVINGGSGAETVLETPVSWLLENGRLDLFA